MHCRAGDIAYTDWPDVNCATNPSHIHCNCERDWLRSNPDSCLAGDVAHARLKFEEQLSNLDYNKFVDFMCSTSREHPWRTLDLSLCDRPILGTWDDHDYNWTVTSACPQKKNRSSCIWMSWECLQAVSDVALAEAYTGGTR